MELTWGQVFTALLASIFISVILPLLLMELLDRLFPKEKRKK